jgi:hypothetical protein
MLVHRLQIIRYACAISVEARDDATIEHPSVIESPQCLVHPNFARKADTGMSRRQVISFNEVHRKL